MLNCALLLSFIDSGFMMAIKSIFGKMNNSTVEKIAVSIYASGNSICSYLFQENLSYNLFFTYFTRSSTFQFSFSHFPPPHLIEKFSPFKRRVNYFDLR